MINQLIKINKPKITESENNGSLYSIESYVKSFLAGMTIDQRKRFKRMLENNIQCGKSVANSYGIDYSEFIKEVKNQLGVN